MHHATTAQITPGRHAFAALSVLAPYLWEFRTRVLLASAFLILAKLASVAVPLVLKQIVDALDRPQTLLVLPMFLLLAYGALRLANALFGELRDVVFAKVLQRSIRRVALRVFRHLHDLALRFHLDRQTGGISRDIERGTAGIRFLLTFVVFNIAPTLVEIGLVLGILLAKLDARFALITFVTISAYIAFTFIITEWRMKFRRVMNDTDSRANTAAIDSLLNYETVKYFGNEDYEARRYDNHLRGWEEAATRSQTSLAALNSGQGGIIAIGVTLLMVLASEGVVQGTLTLGDLVMVNAFLIQLYMPMRFLGTVYREIRQALADMERMFGLIELTPEIRDRPGAPALVINKAHIRFERVCFGYEPERRILFDVDFEIPPRSKVAVVGPSGAGKSTLARLLFRFYDALAGRILIDDQDLRDVTQASLRAAIGIVPQDTVLFNDSIYYNIAYGRPQASREEIIQAAKHAHIHEFIASLPKGYDTLVGERGLKLSGGEKQRVAIARTILKAPPILVFDEATSALDSATEKAIQAQLAEVAANRSTLVIAHRLSTVMDADQILVMERGRILERGTHAELLAREGRYARMWALQQREERERLRRAAGNGLQA